MDSGDDPLPPATRQSNNIYVFRIGGEGKSATHQATALISQKWLEAKLIHPRTLPARRGADRHQIHPRAIEDAIKLGVKMHNS
jgi:hypothetical protein